MKYFQTWNRVTKIRRLKIVGPILYVLIQFLCGIITRHCVSKTEWGYDGGDIVDGCCRWCNKHIPIKYDTALFIYPNFKHYRHRVGGKTTDGS